MKKKKNTERERMDEMNPKTYTVATTKLEFSLLPSRPTALYSYATVNE